jgi:phosphoribosylformimino-5-aminoimidazole carboxamide ribotide isomerase
MEILPAIDLMKAKCVRLTQGREEDAMEYSADPVGVARDWWQQGARTLHLVNLDGAFDRNSQNLETLREMASSVPLVIHYGGGLRSLEAMTEALEGVAAKIVLGTVAVEDPALLKEALRRFGAERIIVALDALNDRVVTRGWRTVSNFQLVELARSMQTAGVREILYTDVSRDGMLTGPNLTMLAKLAGAGLRILSSGGVRSPDDVRTILSLNEPRISGVVVGKALYERRVTLRELIEAAKFTTTAEG